MAESDLQAIRNGFRTVVEGITGLHVYAAEPDVGIEYPAVVVSRTQPINYQQGPIGANHMLFDLLCICYVRHRRNSEAGRRMDEYLSPTGAESIRAKIKTDTSLNGSVTYAELIQIGEVQHDRDENERHWELSANFRVKIIKNIA